MVKVNKFLYETSVNKSVSESVTEKIEENGQTVEIKRTVKKVKPIKIAILKPDRQLYKQAEMFYAKTLSEYLKAGLLSYSLVAKRYANDGGPLTDKEQERLKVLRTQAHELEKEFFTNIPEEDEASKTKKNDILVKINSINYEINAIQNSYSDIFDNTAEMKSRNDTIEWWVLHLAYFNEDEKEFKSVFSGQNYEEKIKSLEDYEDKENKFHLEVIKELSYLISFWFASRNTVTNIEFGQMEKLYLDTVSDYKVDKEPEVKISEPATPPV